MSSIPVPHAPKARASLTARAPKVYRKPVNGLRPEALSALHSLKEDLKKEGES